MNALNDYKRNIVNYKTSNQQYVNSFIDNINDSFELSPSYFQVTKNKDYLTKYDCWILDNSSHKKVIPEKKIVMSPNQSINIGEYIIWMNDIWLCISADHENPMYQSGIIKKCNNTLKFYDNNHILQEEYCVIPEKYSTTEDLDYSKQLLLPNNQIRIWTQYNTISNTIKWQEMYTRFILNNDAWRVVSIDRVRNVKNGIGYIEIRCQSDLITPNDSLELGIADYYKKDNQDDLNLHIKNGNTIQLALNSTVQLQTEILKGDSPVDLPLIYESSDIIIAEIDAKGLITPLSNGNVQIKVSLKDNPLIYNTLILNVINTFSNDNYSLNILSTTNFTIKERQTTRFDINVFNNGILVNEDVVWSGIDVDLVEVVEQTGTYIRLKGLKSTGSFTLNAKLTTDNSIHDNKNITLKNIMG